ncbi:glycine cleavage system aminomethyltransferase GcvT [Mesorhizobium sp. M3A.F.Ca.ET.080.04.2.1]|uniref:glycine cleavage system aminomethyltransferase GcvT n=1 Tax=Mesorhizobium sp. M3A.F.Ca.ET.080.04.2.1 TaxID=2493676 RepID=UPI000F759C62|nr:glycine cleavage system aminomethyltransferase GcvT [Mesorhizobium sp. M3A.F.Ca.ET.080.04.2.1]AZO07895.1 glycine cleavage system aminomethyltransferase GcvT [Mesorhizobium sp. M3A.F.Ca.ET.080.04.2.1]RWF22049.1 MAG: glycine cleavage system aminomethyltransferase GcvT [Mesorhizobium sp.]
MAMIRRTPYYHKHAAAGAEFVDRIGFAAALHFGSVEAEHIAAREKVGLFDVYSQYFLEVTGVDALRLMQKLCVNDIGRMRPSGVVYTSLCNAEGGMIDDLLVYRMAEDTFRVCPTPSRIVAVEAWIREVAGDLRVQLINYGARFGYMSVQGPNSRALLSRLTDADLSAAKLKYFSFVIGELAGIPEVMISRTGYSGELGYELFYPSEYAEHVWDRLIEAGTDVGVRPCGLGSLATLRMEKKFPLYGLDLSTGNTPVEAGLEWTVRLDKPEFIGRDVIARQMEEGPSRRLMLIAAADLDVPLEIGADITVDGRKAGTVTSVAKGFTVRKALAQGYVISELAKDGQQVVVEAKAGPSQAVLHGEALYDPNRERARA